MIEEVVKQVPALGVLAWLVWKFLRHLAELNERQEKRAAARQERQIQADKDREAFLRSMAAECHAVQREAVEAIRDAKGVMARLEER